MNKKWEAYEKDEAEIKKISENNNISTLLSTILYNRGIKDSEIKKFLNPKLEDLYEPFLFKDMDKAVDRICKAIDSKEHITIYGDYDVDGITSTAILVQFLASRGAVVDYHLPNRLVEGYGLNNSAIDDIKTRETTLLITVDCGISAYDEVEYAKSLGIDVIITDHHECPAQIPDAIAVIDAKRPDNTYPCAFLAGCGVSFKLVQAICKTLSLPDEEYLKFLDITALGTIADIVPLLDENRIIVKYGLEAIKKTSNIGLKSLINVSGVKSIDSTSISFGLAPRINACGRMGKADLALKMLLTNSFKEANEIANELQRMNFERQEIERGILNEALEQINREHLDKDKIIVCGSENWHHGVIGIVSSKITETYYKPSILVCFESDEGKGSGRSVDGFDLHSALLYCEEYLQKYGGHEMAIGLTLKKSDFEQFKKILNDYAKDKLPNEATPVVKYDCEITSKDITMDTIKELRLLEPYGEANPTPLFLYKNIRVDSIRTLSNEKKLKLNIKDEHRIFSAIAFNMGDKKNYIKMGEKATIIHSLEVNTYNGVNMIQLNIKDIKKSI